MREDHARCIHFDRFAHNFTRMYLNMVQGTRKKMAVFQHPFLLSKKITIKISRSTSVN